MFYEADENDNDEESDDPSDGPPSSTDDTASSSSDPKSNDPIMNQIVRIIFTLFKFKSSKILLD